jgi:phosphoglucosamine mutase
LLRQSVLKHQADLGVALDGDGDRAVLIDHKGYILDGDELLYIIAKHKLAQHSLKGGVVGTVMSNLGFEQALKQLGLEFVRVPVGDRHIMSELHKRQWHLGGEPSGHVVCLESIQTGDGIITALQVFAAMRSQQRTLAEARAGLVKYPQVLLNIKVSQPNASLDSKRIQQAISDGEHQLGEKGRIILRRSGTEPLVRVMVEGENEKLVTQLAQHLADVVSEELKN